MNLISGKCRAVCLAIVIGSCVSACVDDAPGQREPETDAAVEPMLRDGGGQIDGSAPECEERESERCDGEDNDCDGKTDEGFPIGETCVKETGLCSSEGTWVCSADGSSTECDAPEPVTSDETCDMTDNDCDGEVDESFDFTSDAENCGACGVVCELANASARCVASRCQIRTCNAGFVNTNEENNDGCECAIQNGGTELCNGLDEDCDGQVDEGFALGAACADGLGQCAANGEVVCGADGDAVCNAVPTPPAAELCNGYDDDCDGAVDETFDGDMDGAIQCDGITCNADEICPDGVDCDAVCRNYDCDDANPQVGPLGIERCGDGIDQNCDGQDADCTVYSGRIVTLSVLPAGSDDCRDLDGDGENDNAFGQLAGLINPQVDNALTNNQLNLHALVYGLETSEVNRRFDFAIVSAVRGQVDASSLDNEGRPINLFPGALVDNGAMAAGPRPFNLSLPIGNGVNLDLPTANTLLSGELTVPARPGDEAGCTIDGGILTGALRQVDLEAAVNAGAPALAPLLGAFQPDLDNDRDGVPESLSVCLSFSVSPAPLGNIPPPLPAAP